VTALRDVARFAALYPEAASLIRHNLPGHAMFELDALADLAGRLDPKTVEYNRCDLPTGLDPNANLAQP
jgi:hypothetical protein